MSKTRNSQLKAVRDYLISNPQGLTQDDAKELCGTTRLGALIYILRHKEGYTIKNEYRKMKNRYGNTCRCAVYHMVKDEVSDTGETA